MQQLPSHCQYRQIQVCPVRMCAYRIVKTSYPAKQSVELGRYALLNGLNIGLPASGRVPAGNPGGSMKYPFGRVKVARILACTRPPSKMRQEISGRILPRRLSLSMSVLPGGCASSNRARCCSRSSARCSTSADPELGQTGLSFSAVSRLVFRNLTNYNA